MRELYSLNFGLGSLPLLSDAETRSISAENPTGEKGGGAKAVPDENNPAFLLGKGWKVRPCIDLEPQSTTVLADIAGPGIIQHIWITVDTKAYRDTVLRMYWDEEEKPSVEVPLGDFFCNGHGMRYNVVSIPIAVNPSGGFNCYFPMPFRKRALITIENQRWEKITGFFYQITYALTDLPEKIAYFHAQWRRSMTKREHPEHIIVDGIVGQGHYVGTFIAWTQFSSGWWGEGEVKFYIDGDTEYPTICGTGTEDYFGGAWCFGQTFNAPFSGYPLWHKRFGEAPKHAMYRWHIYDPIRFKQNLKVTIQALGWWPNGRFQPLTDDIASVAYWYQVEPHAPFPQLPSAEERWPR
ncbi:glycoside hydrolase family 172 protein [Pseudothermotoga hypogea]|uniref:glycoside hydrolase family 172 protein n=1 Tax=Pseudothermotoga hypogea TaxID=57487 RepID=UPI0018D2BF0A|nr:glycoside hydrolase family 172 protein [Pseudothermotoga hypogea]